jgi:hypothetical protein
MEEGYAKGIGLPKRPKWRGEPPDLSSHDIIQKQRQEGTAFQGGHSKLWKNRVGKPPQFRSSVMWARGLVAEVGAK